MREITLALGMRNMDYHSIFFISFFLFYVYVFNMLYVCVYMFPVHLSN